jgi:hypothetical protein
MKSANLSKNNDIRTAEIKMHESNLIERHTKVIYKKISLEGDLKGNGACP